MEKEMSRIKSQMLESELEGFEFTNEMKRTVLNEITTRKRNKQAPVKRMVPIFLSGAFAVASAAGIFAYISDGTGSPSTDSAHIKQQAAEEKKPVLVPPKYIPESFIHKHVHAGDDELYEHVYENSLNKAEFFAYKMQKKHPVKDKKAVTEEIQLASGLTGTFYQFTDKHSLILWEDEGFYQAVEQEGNLSKEEMLKITASILEQKGFDPLIPDKNIEKPNTSEPPNKTQNEDHSKAAAQESNEQEKDTAEKEIKAVEAPKKESSEQQPKDTPENGPDVVNLFKDLSSVLDKIYSNSSVDNTAYKLQYESMDDLLAEFDGVSERGAAEYHFGYLFEEKNDGLYIVATEGPLMFQPGLPYEVEKVSDEKYKLTQFHESDLHGTKDFVAYLEYKNGSWMITSIETLEAGGV
ncbi:MULTISPECIES: DUF4367 domain-containing protein [Bacillus]|uniref:DUF4367 domain-containing protein n=1 Tax=Bacillus infantis TaxID=324767 RepID=A0A5D4SNI7_9BACI|nr:MULTISPECIES: DUF4367 domain-containing protein [Bacillus]MCP1160534.1 DUF4367 domain-containing protein [Bacillus infantis]PLR73684.1 hypothetical protein CYJ37_09165 [Bacillus sp. UMB0728]TYS63788.1 DUF4367 domain-containing protein [Bacillus infantis]